MEDNAQVQDNVMPRAQGSLVLAVDNLLAALDPPPVESLRPNIIGKKTV